MNSYLFFAAEVAQPPMFLQPQFLLPVAMIAFMYFSLIRPQQRKQKEHAEVLKKLDKNDEIITEGGVHATVVSVGDKTVILRIADNVKIEIEKASVQLVKKSRQSS